MSAVSIRLADDRDPWDRQPDETPHKYGQFLAYRDLGRARTLAKTGEALGRSAGYLRLISAEYRWVERAEAWDQDLDQAHQREWLDTRRAAAEHDARILNKAAEMLADRLDTLDPDDLSPGDVARLLDVVMRHRRTLFGDPTATIAVTGPAGDPLTVRLAEFAALPADQRRAAAVDLADTVRRRALAASGADDDDDE